MAASSRSGRAGAWSRSTVDRAAAVGAESGGHLHALDRRRWLFVVTDDARLACLSRASGKARWISQLPRYRNVKKRKGPITWFGPVLAGGRLVLTNSDGQIVSAGIGDGKIVSTIETKTAFSLPPVVALSTLYTIDERGRLTAFR